MNERFRIYAAVALTGLFVVGGGLFFISHSSPSSAASVHQIKPFHPHAKAKVALAPPKVTMTKAKSRKTHGRRPRVWRGAYPARARAAPPHGARARAPPAPHPHGRTLARPGQGRRGRPS